MLKGEKTEIKKEDVGSVEEVLGEVTEPEIEPEVESEPLREPEMRPEMTKGDYYKKLFQGGK